MDVAGTARRSGREALRSADHTLESFQKRIEVDKEMLLVLLERSPQLILNMAMWGLCIDLHSTESVFSTRGSDFHTDIEDGKGVRQALFGGFESLADLAFIEECPHRIST